MMQALKKLILGCCLLAVAGCGFHLRGAASLPESLNTIYVQGVNLHQGFGLSLKRALTRNGVTVLEDYQQGASVLTILQHRVDQRVLSVGSDAKVSEYEIQGLLTYKVTDGQGQILADVDSIEASTDYVFDQDAVLGKGEELRQLTEQINQQMLSNMLRRLEALK